MSTPPAYKAAILLFPGADILDYAGPAEILSNTTHDANPMNPLRSFNITTFSTDNDVSTGHGALTISPAITLVKAKENLEAYDVLIVPGGPPDRMLELAETGKEELDIIRKFASLAEADDGRKRYLLSVCTGSFLLAAAGVLAGKEATTHFMALDGLKMLSEKAGGGTEVVKKRWVEQEGRGGLVVTTSGGISCGLDATLHLVEKVVSRVAAEGVAGLMEYDWREEL